MTKDKTDSALRDMLGYAKEACALVNGKSREEFDSDRLLNLSLSRLLEIIGEAANRVSPAYRRRHPEIAWRQIIDMRNRLIHGYDIVDLDIVWNSVTQDIPVLITSLEKIVPKEN
jgi:uncharacterized protein with HEPN domain